MTVNPNDTPILINTEIYRYTDQAGIASITKLTPLIERQSNAISYLNPLQYLPIPYKHINPN